MKWEGFWRKSAGLGKGSDQRDDLAAEADRVLLRFEVALFVVLLLAHVRVLLGHG